MSLKEMTNAKLYSLVLGNNTYHGRMNISSGSIEPTGVDALAEALSELHKSNTLDRRVLKKLPDAFVDIYNRYK